MRIDLKQEVLLENLPGEDVDLEAKLAGGRDGKGDLPESFWETYSAMANTDGGYILLGVEEKPQKHFHLIGIEDPERVLKKLWDCLNDRDKISANLLTKQDVVTKQEEQKNLVPSVQTTERPRGQPSLRGELRIKYPPLKRIYRQTPNISGKGPNIWREAPNNTMFC